MLYALAFALFVLTPIVIAHFRVSRFLDSLSLEEREEWIEEMHRECNVW